MKLNKVSSVLLIIIGLFVLSACNSNNADNVGNAEGSLNESANVSKDPLEKYETMVDVHTVRYVNQAFKYKDGDSIDENIWTRIFEDDYNINVINDWVVDESQYRQKLNVSIASGDLPDFLEVNKEELMRLVDSGQVADLTDIINDYGSDYLMEMLEQDNGTALNAASVDGKVYGLPKMMVNGGVSTAEMIYIRTDWLENLGLEIPKTIDELIEIATAFTHKDPDGNGENDTVGLGINNELFLAHGSLKGFFNGYGAYPNIWVKDDNGDLAYGSIQDEMKPGLEKLSELYAEGVIDKEFSVKPWNKVAEDIAADRVGLAYGTVSDGGHIHKASKDNNPEAEWQVIPIVSLDGSLVDPQLGDTADNFYVVSEDSEHPEAMVKLANIYLEHYYLTDYTPDPNPFISDADGIYPGKYQPVTTDPLNVNLDAFRDVREALEQGDGSHLGYPADVHYERMSQYLDGDDTMWFSNIVFGPENSSYSVIEYYDNEDLGIYSEFQGAATPAISKNMSTLESMQNEVFTKIIMGASPLNEFDEFVKDWKQLGGDQITEEVNEWYQIIN